MDALAEGVEVLAALIVEEHDLAVHDGGARGELELGEVASHRLARARLQIDLIALDEGDGAEPVPLGFVDPLIARRQLLRRAGELREEGWPERGQLEDVLALAETGPVLGTVLQRSGIDRPQHRGSGSD